MRSLTTGRDDAGNVNPVGDHGDGLIGAQVLYVVVSVRSGRDDALCAEFDTAGDGGRVFASITSSVGARGGDRRAARPWLLSDADAVVAAFCDPEIQRWHVRRADSVDEARQWITGWKVGWADEAQLNWALVDRASDSLMGRVSLKGVDFHDGSAGVAYWMVPAWRGRGLCSQAVLALCQWAFNEAGFHRIGLAHSVANLASCRVAAKAGFRAEGIRRGAALHADGWHDMHVHALLADQAPEVE